MKTLLTTYRLLLTLSPLLVPSLLGVLVYFRVRKYHYLLAHLVGFLLPPVLTFYFVRMALFGELERAAAHQRICGLAVMATAFVILGATGLQILSSLAAQLVLRGREMSKTVST